MSYGTSIHSHTRNPQITVEGFRGISREKRPLPGHNRELRTISTQIEARLVMDRLLRECLKREITVGTSAAH